MILRRRALSPWLVVVGLTAAGCATTRSGDPLSLDEIVRCDKHPVERVLRPVGPRTPEAREWSPRCDPFRVYRLPQPVSNQPTGGTTLRAGFAEVDITPAPGLGTLGWGTEARMARGFRNRLHARAMVLEDRDGRVVAFVVADLDVISTILHREVAERAHAVTGGVIGADRLTLSATHTHSGPGNFLSAYPLNLIGSNVPFYDHAFVEWMAHRIAGAIKEAYTERRRARVAWGMRNVWGHTKNRAMPAYGRNRNTTPFPVTPPDPPAPRSLSDAERAVNPRWAMLRVETRRDGGWELAGTFNIFSIHGTVVPGGNDLYDADVQGVIARRLHERLGGIHLVANGTEGDVRPKWPDDSRCPLPSMDNHPRAGGPRIPPPVFEWVENSRDELVQCLDKALDYLEQLGSALASEAESVFRSLDGALTDNALVRRNFETVHLTGQEGTTGHLCPRPQVGGALVAGGVDGPSRFKDWKLFGIWSLGIAWGPNARNEDSNECHSPKLVVLPFLQRHPVGPYQFPEYAQFAVIRIDDAWIGTVPAEPTMVTGRQLMAALRKGAGRAIDQEPDDVPADRLVILGLANGYLNYVATADEYQEQLYEGASTLYGAHSAAFMASRLRGLAAAINAPNANPVGEILVRPGPQRQLLPRNPSSGGPSSFLANSLRSTCTPRFIEVSWIDSLPGQFNPADAVMVRFTSGNQQVEDGRTSVEVWMGEPAADGQRWTARWRPRKRLAPGSRVDFELARWANARGRCTVLSTD